MPLNQETTMKEKRCEWLSLLLLVSDAISQSEILGLQYIVKYSSVLQGCMCLKNIWFLRNLKLSCLGALTNIFKMK